MHALVATYVTLVILVDCNCIYTSYFKYTNLIWQASSSLLLVDIAACNVLISVLALASFNDNSFNLRIYVCSRSISICTVGSSD